MFSERYDKRIKEIAFVQRRIIFFLFSFAEARYRETINCVRVYLAIGIVFYGMLYFSHYLCRAILSSITNTRGFQVSPIFLQ